MARLSLLGVVVLLSACAPAEPPSIGMVSQALGEPMNGFPSPDERLGIMAINRARSDPNTVKGSQSMSYPAVAPVQLAYALNRSSRFHAANLEKSHANLTHTSPCTLQTTVASASCDGSPSCACSGGTIANACKNCADVDAIMNGCSSSGSGNGTSTFTRIGYFTAGTTVDGVGEVAAAGYDDPFAVVDGWMDEAAGEDGHRTNLTDQDGIGTQNVMGFGHATGNGCFDSFDVSDSGVDSALVAVNIPTAAVRPTSGDAGTYTFYATWADGAGAPTSINVVVDGACTTMTKELGNDTLNATYKASVSLASGCHQYRIVAYDKANARQTYPTTGALTVASGGTCSADFEATAMSAPCDTIEAQPDGSLSNPRDGGDVGGDLSTAAAQDFATEPGDVVTQGGGCNFTRTSSASSALALLLFAATLVLRRRNKAR